MAYKKNTKEETFRKGLVDMLYFGFITSVVGIVLVKLYPVASFLIGAGILSILLAGFLMIRQKLN